MTELETIGAGFVTSSRSQWTTLVKLARKVSAAGRDNLASTLATAAGVGRSTLRRKLEAIHMAMKTGLSDERLIEMGQKKVMADFVNGKRAARDDEQVILKWMVAPGLKYAVQEEVWRIAQILGLKTSDEWWSFFHSVMVSWTKEEILHLAGEGNANRVRQPNATEVGAVRGKSTPGA